jgi:hypothetical protein
VSRSRAANLTVLGIWVGVALISALSPDMVTGSEHEHLPIAAITAWLWGLFATGYILLLALLTGESDIEESAWRNLVLAVGGVWLLFAALSIFGPVMVTGSDPTRLPIISLIAPPAATAGTLAACLLLATSGHMRGRGTTAT